MPGGTQRAGRMNPRTENLSGNCNLAPGADWAIDAPWNDGGPEPEERKICTRCEESKPATAEYFYRRNKARDGLHPWCKECAKTRQRQHYQKNTLRIRARSKRWREENSERVQVQRKQYYQENAPKIRAQTKQYRQENPDKVRAGMKRWLQKNPMQRLRRRVSKAIGKALHRRKNGEHWEELVGYTLDDLVRHLTDLFQPGMTWDNYGDWHIDHVRSVSSFNFKSPDDPDFKRCYALSNLQPLWACDNAAKGGR